MQPTKQPKRFDDRAYKVPDSSHVNHYWILYVDDDTKALKAFQNALNDRYLIATARSVEAALEILKKKEFRVGIILTDQRMPVRTGVDLLQVVRECHPEIIRILTTAYTDFNALTQAVNKGAIHAFI